MTCVQAGDRVRIQYTTSSLQKNVLETSHNRQPLEFTAGGLEMIPGISAGVIGMTLGARQQLVIAPQEAYGHRDPQLEQRVPLSSLPEKIQAGDQFSADMEGTQVDFWVRSLEGSEALLDANHPLAGETLICEIELIGHDVRE